MLPAKICNLHWGIHLVYLNFYWFVHYLFTPFPSFAPSLFSSHLLFPPSTNIYQMNLCARYDDGGWGFGYVWETVPGFWYHQPRQSWWVPYPKKCSKYIRRITAFILLKQAMLDSRARVASTLFLWMWTFWEGFPKCLLNPLSAFWLATPCTCQQGESLWDWCAVYCTKRTA